MAASHWPPKPGCIAFTMGKSGEQVWISQMALPAESMASPSTVSISDPPSTDE